MAAEEVDPGIVGRFGADQHPPGVGGIAGQASERVNQLSKVPRTYLGRSATGGGAGGQTELAAHPCHGAAL